MTTSRRRTAAERAPDGEGKHEEKTEVSADGAGELGGDPESNPDGNPDIMGPPEMPEVLAAIAPQQDQEEDDDDDELEVQAPVIDVTEAGAQRAELPLIGYSALGT